MAKKILVFGEQRGGALKKSVLEIIGLAQSISGGGSVDVVTMGEGIGSVGEALAATGASVHVADDASLAQPSPEAYVAQIDAAVQAVQPDVVLFTASAMGRDLAPRVAARMGAGFIPVRKAGKLPWAVVREEYQLEYGRDKLEIHRDAIHPGERILVIDDVLATGGTAEATCRLVEALGGTVVGLGFLIELADLGGRARLGGHLVESLAIY